VKINRSVWISVTDIVSFFSFLFLAFSGVVIRYVLPKGSGGGGQGWRSASKPVLEFWNLSRHQWGSVHFWVSMIFVTAILLHLFLHWKWVKVSLTGRKRRSKIPTTTS
jgi:hypothetical protein